MSYKNNINIDLHCSDQLYFLTLQDKLSTQGYGLRFSTLAGDAKKVGNNTDLYIVDISNIECLAKIPESESAPYLIMGVETPLGHDLPEDFLKNSVGFLNANPSFEEICIAVQLGLQWHDERVRFSKRVLNIEEKITNNRLNGVAIGMLMQKTGLSEDDVLSCLKDNSRKKQRRMVDVSCEIISQSSGFDDFDTTSNDMLGALNDWIDVTVSVRES